MIMIMVIIIIIIINVKILSLAPRPPSSNGPISLLSFTIKIFLQNYVCSSFCTFPFLSPDFHSLQTGFVPIMLLKLLLSRSPMNSILPKTAIKISFLLAAFITLDTFSLRKSFPHVAPGKLLTGRLLFLSPHILAHSWRLSFLSVVSSPYTHTRVFSCGP